MNKIFNKIKLTALFLVAVFSVNAQSFKCNVPLCTGQGFNQGDMKIINNTLLNIWKLDSANGGGGGSALRQSTLDSINHASYYSGIGVSQSNLISQNNSFLGDIITLNQQSLDSLHLIKNDLEYGGESIGLINTIGNNNTNACAISLSVLQSNFGGYSNSFVGKHGTNNITNSVFWTDGAFNSVFQDTMSGNSYSIANLLMFQKQFNDGFMTNNINSITGSNLSIKAAVEYTQGQLGNNSGANSVMLDISGKSVFTNDGASGKSYFKNTGLSDTLITVTTSMADLVTAVNLFYAEHPNRQIKDVSYTNALITATLNYFAVIRFED